MLTSFFDWNNAMSKSYLKWDKLDNTAHLFPVIAGESMSNVYRISVLLKDEIDPEALQKALNSILPDFDGFNMKLKRGVFWYYFEENIKKAPQVMKEHSFPCRYIRANMNNEFMFRVTYYENRINLEVFHVLTDGAGAMNFLKELTYKYLRLTKEELSKLPEEGLSEYTSFSREDSFLKNYRNEHKNIYKSERAYILKGEKLEPGEFGVMHMSMSVAALKSKCKEFGVTINEYLVSVFAWSVYKEYLHRMPEEKPIRIAVPVNLRPYFDSITTKNFFAVVSAEFRVDREDYTFEEVVNIIKNSLREQINKENLEKLFSYNVSNETHLWARMVPLFIKNIAISSVYTKSALANTSTVTNIGNITVEEAYKPYIEGFRAFLSMSKGQNLKGTICSYDDELIFSFSYVLKDVSLQRCFARKLAEDGICVCVSTNGVENE